MPYHANKVDKLIQYALLVAGQEDDFSDRQLGPIHLIKYVYLADLAHAKRHNGETYTGTEWRFYKFGPWAQTVNARIEPALAMLRADRRVFESDSADRDEWVRWNKRDDRLLEEIERQLPPGITRTLKLQIHTFRKDTPLLLDYVYKTDPMISAAPNEVLDFNLVPESPITSDSKSASLDKERLSAKKQKKFKEGMRAIRSKRKSGRPKEAKLVSPPILYDDVYHKGMEWLESLAGPELSEQTIVAEFCEDVWKSETRKAKDVS